MKPLHYLLALWLGLFLQKADAIVLADPNDTNNLLAPEEFPYWENVIGVSGASGVYLGEGWVLTANHVGTPSNVSITGSTYTVTAGSAIGSIQNMDLKLFQVSNWQTITAPNIDYFDGWINSPEGQPQENGPALAVGYGVTNGTPITGGYNWGGTAQKRWGDVTLNASGGANLVNKTIESRFDRTLGPDSAAFAVGDSGGGVFYQKENGEWALAGIMTHVTHGGRSLYDVDPTTAGDQPGGNYSQRVSAAGLSIYKTTGIWGGNPEDRMDLHNMTLAITEGQTRGLFEVTGTENQVTTSNEATLAVGTVWLKTNSQIEVENTYIETVAADSNTTLTMSGSSRILLIQTGGNLTITTSGEGNTIGGGNASQTQSLSVLSGTLKVGNLITERLEIGTNGPAEIIKENPQQYQGLSVTGSLHIAEEGSADLLHLGIGFGAQAQNEGTLYLGKDTISQIWLSNPDLELTDTSRIVLDLDANSADSIMLENPGTLLLNGELVINLLPDTTPEDLLGKSFSLMQLFIEDEILNDFTGMFSNVSEGRINLADGSGSFKIEIQQNAYTWVGPAPELILSDFQIGTVPEPNTAALIGSLGIWGLLQARRRVHPPIAKELT